MKMKYSIKQKPTLWYVDLMIVVVFLGMLLPIYFKLHEMPHQIGNLTPFFAYMADVITIIAALYGGRAVFLTSSQTVDSGANTVKETGIEATSPTKKEIINTVQSEKPERTFFVMFGFLAAYGAIKITDFLSEKNDAKLWLLSILMVACSCMLSLIVFKEFLKDEKHPWLRPILAILPTVFSFLLACLLHAK